MKENTVFYLSNDRNNGISLPIEGTLTSDKYLNAEKGITNKNLVKVEIGTKVTSIGYGAFQYCWDLQSVTIPDSVKSIGVYAFLYCKNLDLVTFDRTSKVESIGINAFQNCSKLNSVTIPDSVTSIGDGAFQYCSKLNSVTFDGTSKVESIGINAFQNCSILNSVTIPDSVTSIGGNAFKNSGIANVKMSVKLAISLHLIPNIKQNFLGQGFVLIECPTTFIQPGIISGSGTEFDAMESGQIVLRYYNPSLRTFEQSRDGLLIVDLSMLQASGLDTSIEEIKWLKKNTDDNNYTEQTDYKNKRTYPYNKHIVKVECRLKAKTGDNDFTVESNPTITDQTKIDTIVNNFFEFETLGNLSGNFTNTEFRKTLTMLHLGTAFETISNINLYQNKTFLYENMQEVEVPSTVISIKDTPFPTSTRYYIRTINKYLKPNEFTWVNDETKQFYFYLNEISDKLAKTKENDGVEFTLIKEPFIYDKTNKKHEKCEDVEYLYLWEGEVKPQKIKSIPIITNGYAINKYAGQIGEIEDSKSWQMQILRDGSDKDKTKLSRDVFESNNDTLIEINKTNNTLIFTNGLFKNFQKDNFEYLRLLDISVKYGIQNKTFKIGIAHSSWGDFQDKVENVENDDDDDPGPVPVTDDDCFPGNSQLILKDGTKKLFHDIEVGDEIQVCSKDMELSYSKVIFLPHLQNNKSTEYIKFTTTSNQTIRATALHLLPVLDKNNTLQNVIAKNITQEDKLYVLNNGKGVPEEIKTIEIIEEKGVYTCLVKEGEYIVVDNIVASPFPGDGLDESYVSKYAFSYTMLRLYAKGFSMLDSMGVLNFTAPLLRSMVFAVANNCHF